MPPQLFFMNSSITSCSIWRRSDFLSMIVSSSLAVSVTGAMEATGHVGTDGSGVLWVGSWGCGDVLVAACALLLLQTLIEGIFFLIAEVIFWMGLRSLVGGGVGGLGLCCFPAAFVEGPTTSLGSSPVAGPGCGL